MCEKSTEYNNYTKQKILEHYIAINKNDRNDVNIFKVSDNSKEKQKSNVMCLVVSEYVKRDHARIN